MRSVTRISRRSFLGKTASMASLSPFMLSSGMRADDPDPSNKISMAFIGIGAQAHTLMEVFLGRKNVRVLAVCDPNALCRDWAKDRVDRQYGNKDCRAYGDFREIMARDDIDAVCIATPDHWHAVITLAAIRSGKDVYCEKPLTHNINEAIAVMAEVKKHNRILQTGSMQRSMSEFRIACELVLNGVIGKLKHVECTFGGWPVPCDLPEETPDAGMDWDMWLGPAPVRPYNSILCPRGAHHGFPNWRNYVEYGGGGNCDFGAHHLDIAQWAMGMDESGPVEIRPPDSPEKKFGATLVYENGITLTNVERFDDCCGVHFICENGQIWADRGRFRMVQGDRKIESQHLANRDYLGSAKIRLIESGSHTDNFLARVADRGRTVANEVAGGHTAIACHLINLACIHGKTIKWDPGKYSFADGTGANAWLTRDYRSPWKV